MKTLKIILIVVAILVAFYIIGNPFKKTIITPPIELKEKLGVETKCFRDERLHVCVEYPRVVTTFNGQGVISRELSYEWRDIPLPDGRTLTLNDDKELVVKEQ